MMIRSKLQAQKTTGKEGSMIWLNAVWEGSSELQALSENAMFGAATPSGSCVLDHSVFDLIEHGEDYYIDMNVEHMPDVPFQVAKYWVRRSFRSEPNSGDTIQYRFCETAGRQCRIDLQVANPTAIEHLDAGLNFHVRISVAKGHRRSDAEIAIREKMLADFDSNTQHNAKWAAEHPLGFAEFRQRLEKKIARAKGF